MCNIAGYAGAKQAAPILLEMIRKMQPYDGDTAVGIATFHEGKIHWRKFHGTAEDFIAQTDVLSLPGTVGIAHTHPGANPNYEFHHPSLSPQGDMALVANGTMPQTKYSEHWTEMVDRLAKDGYHFIHRSPNTKGRHPKLSATGEGIAAAEVCCFVTDHYIKQGCSVAEALAKTGADLMSDVVQVMINEQHPDSIFALRTTRPMYALMENGETRIATTPFAFDQDQEDRFFSLPLYQVCQIKADGVTVTPYRIQSEPVAEMSPFTYKTSYERIEALLSEGDPLFFDDLESALNKMRDLWEGDHTYVQHARLLYELLWQFEKEGRLVRELRTQAITHGTRRRWYFSLKK